METFTQTLSGLQIKARKIQLQNRSLLTIDDKKFYTVQLQRPLRVNHLDELMKHKEGGLGAIDGYIDSVYRRAGIERPPHMTIQSSAGASVTLVPSV